VTSKNRGFGVRFAPNRAWRAPYRGPILGGGRKGGENSGRAGETGARRESWHAGEIGTCGRNTAQREERAGDLEGETVAAVDLRALTREEGEAEGRERKGKQRGGGKSRAAHQEGREAE